MMRCFTTLMLTGALALSFGAKGYAMECVNDDRYVQKEKANVVAEGTLLSIQNMLEFMHGDGKFAHDVQKNGVPYELTVAVKKYAKKDQIGVDDSIISEVYAAKEALTFTYPVKNAPSPDIKQDGKITGIKAPGVDLKLGDSVALYIADYFYTHSDTPTMCSLVKR